MATWHKDKAIQLLEEEGYDALVNYFSEPRTTIEPVPDGGDPVPDTVEFHDEEYYFLGKDGDQGHLHFYRYTPEHADVLLVSHDDEGNLREDDHWRLVHGDPEQTLREYVYQHPWEETREIKSHDYRSLPDPGFRPDLNEGLGGSLLLDDYVVPFRAPFGTLARILEQESQDRGDIYVDYRPLFLELTPSDALEKYQLSPGLRGNNEITGTRIVDEITILDRGSEEVYTTFHVDDLAQDYFIDALAQVEGLDKDLARQWITGDGEGYKNLRTASWALTSDTAHLTQEYGVDCRELFKEFGEAEVYRNEHSADAGVLHLPERKQDELEADEEDEVEEDEDTVQSGLTDY